MIELLEYKEGGSIRIGLYDTLKEAYDKIQEIGQTDMHFWIYNTWTKSIVDPFIDNFHIKRIKELNENYNS